MQEPVSERAPGRDTVLRLHRLPGGPCPPKPTFPSILVRGQPNQRGEPVHNPLTTEPVQRDMVITFLAVNEGTIAAPPPAAEISTRTAPTQAAVSAPLPGPKPQAEA